MSIIPSVSGSSLAPADGPGPVHDSSVKPEIPLRVKPDLPAESGPREDRRTPSTATSQRRATGDPRRSKHPSASGGPFEPSKPKTAQPLPERTAPPDRRKD